MKKRIIKNWIKYWASTLAVSGMLVLGACGSNEREAETESKVEATENGLQTPERETVSREVEENEYVIDHEAGTETDETENLATNQQTQTATDATKTQATEQQSNQQLQENQTTTKQQLEYERTSNTTRAKDVKNMDSHVKKHQDVNEAIDKKLVESAQTKDANKETDNLEQDKMEDSDLKRENMKNDQMTQDLNLNQDTEVEDKNTEAKTEENQQMEQDAQNQQSDYETDEQVKQDDIDHRDQTATYEKLSNREETPDLNKEQKQQESSYFVVFIDQYEKAYMEDLEGEERQRMESIMNDYKERRESMKGQINEETGAYLAPEVDAKPKAGYEQLINQIEDDIQYPQNALAAELEGTIFVNFVVDENGKVTNAEAIEDVIAPATSMQSTTSPLNPTSFTEEEVEETVEEMKKEAVRAVEATSGQWQAASQEGKNVKMELQLPVKFEIRDNGKDVEIEQVEDKQKLEDQENKERKDQDEDKNEEEK